MDETMGNQQVTQVELAWLAGIWDGEGTISIRRVVLRGEKPQYSPRVCVVNTNTAIISRVRSLLDSLGVSYYFREREGNGGFPGSYLQCWIISIDTLTHAKTLLVHIRPYLIGKTFQADCILEFCERRIAVADRKAHTNKARAYMPRDFELVENVYVANGDIRGTSETVRQDAQRAMIQSDLSRKGETWSETAMRHY